MAGQGSTGNVIAAVCSFFVPGLGQLVQGRLGIAIIQFALAVFLYAPARRSGARAGAGSWPVRLLEQGLYAEWLTQTATQPLLVVAERMSSFDNEVTAPLAVSMGESVELAASGVGAFRHARLSRYLAGGLLAIAILALLSVLAATGHLWVHPR